MKLSLLIELIDGIKELVKKNGGNPDDLNLNIIVDNKHALLHSIVGQSNPDTAEIFIDLIICTNGAEIVKFNEFVHEYKTKFKPH